MNPRDFAGMIDWAVRNDRDHARAIDKMIADRFKFTSRWVSTQDVKRRVQWFTAVVRSPRSPAPKHLLEKILRDFHFQQRSDLMAAFLDCCGVEHNGGRVSGETPPLTYDAAKRCASELSPRFDPERVVTYLAWAGWDMEPWRQILWQVVDEQREEKKDEGKAPASAEQKIPTESPPVEPEITASNNGLSVLDDVLVKASIASLSRVEGAFTVDHIADAIEELISLSSDRHQSYFHRGFLSVLGSVPLPERFDERNNSSIGWLLAGQAMAMARRQDWQSLTSFYEVNRQTFRQLLLERHPALPMVSPQIFEAFWSQERHEDAIATLNARVLSKTQREFQDTLLLIGEQLLLERHTAEARRILDVLDEATREDSAEFPAFAQRLARRRAQALRAEGNFDSALTALRELTDRTATESRPELQADIGLCEGRFRWLSEIRLPLFREDVPDLVKRLEAGESEWNAAVSSTGGRTTNAEYACGVLALLRDNYETARDLLRRAYSGVLERSETYQQGGLVDLVREHYGISILLSLDVPEFENARELLAAPAMKSRPLPRWLADQMLEAALDLANSDSRATLVQILLARNPELLEICLKKDPETLGDQLGLSVSTLVDFRSQDPSRTPPERWEASIWLLTAQLRRGDMESARETLDTLEGLASEDARLRTRLVEHLSDPVNYTPAWTQDDANYVVARTYEELGDFQQATSVLRSQFHVSAAKNDAEEALGILERISSFGIDPASYEDMERRAAALLETLSLATAPGSSPVPSDAKLAVLFVGGNEQQQAYDLPVRQELAQIYPSLTVEFMHTGWSSSWGGYLDDVKRKIQTVDALVIMRMIRTGLGRSLRVLANDMDVPWVSCTGRGRKSISLSIQKAVRIAMRDGR